MALRRVLQPIHPNPAGTDPPCWVFYLLMVENARSTDEPSHERNGSIFELVLQCWLELMCMAALPARLLMEIPESISAEQRAGLALTRKPSLCNQRLPFSPSNLSRARHHLSSVQAFHALRLTLGCRYHYRVEHRNNGPILHISHAVVNCALKSKHANRIQDEPGCPVDTIRKHRKSCCCFRKSSC